jgi:prolyl oligopeptidase
MATPSARNLALALASAFVVVVAHAAHAARITYPVAPRGTVVDDYHGVRVADPYRWLEESKSPESRAWLDAEQKLTSQYLAGLPGGERLRARLGELADARETGVPWREAGRILFLENRGNQPQSVLYAIERAGADPHVLFDPNRVSPDGSTAIGDYVMAPDGNLLAYSMSVGGADAASIRVRNLATGADLEDDIVGMNACWTRDSRGFFYAQSFKLDASDAGSARAGVRGYYHELGQPQTSDRVIKEWDERARWVYFMTSEEGRYALAVAEEGTVSEVFNIDLGDPAHPDPGAMPVQLLRGTDGFHTGVEWVKDSLYLRTRAGAPRGRIVAVDLRDPDAKPRVVVPESADVITDAVITGERLVVNYLSDVHSRVRLFMLDGTPAGEVPLPALGTVGWPLSGRPSTPELFFSFDSFLIPASICACDVRARKVSVFRSTPAPFDATRFETKQVFYASKDGTRVPMFITARKGIAMDGSHPVFLTAYGGYGATMEAHYSPDIPLWLEAGGIYVLANIRGGGEYGDAWHKAGMLDKKQNSFDDFIAAAEFLIRERYTSRGKIAIFGHSNGGLLIGAVLTQRPDLFGAAVANAGHYDMLRYHKFTAGAAWVTEYGSPDSAADFKYLYAYSPLQNVKAGTCYPPTLLLAADHDDRVVPSHAYKFAAALQAAQSCDAPVLVRVAENASHGYASRQEMLAEHADMWAFIARQLGLSP